MTTYVTPWQYFLTTHFSTQLILAALVGASLCSWLLMIYQALALRTLKKAHLKFEKAFWSEIRLSDLYEALPQALPPEQIGAIFYAGFSEFSRLRSSGCQALSVVLEGVSRAMHIAHSQAEVHMEGYIHWIGLISSTSPYLGLLGTTFGTISTLRHVGHSISPNAILLIAPGIADALLVSIFSLLTVIPATIFYQYYSNEIDKLSRQYHIFEEEFIALLLRQSYEEQNDHTSPYASQAH